jgi:S-DNA-T family DNA segregation ATPase FtsK/SpoIIIE
VTIIMTSEPTEPAAESANVVQLRAVDAQTEVALDEGKPPGPSYVDLTAGDAQRRDIIPEHWRTLENAKRHVALMAARHGHRAAYHGVRSPAYFFKALAFAVWGVIVTGRRLITWWHIPGTGELERKAAADGLIHDHLRIHKQGRETRQARGTILALCLAGLIAVVVAMIRFAPWWAWTLAAAALFALFALAGRPQGKTITTKAEIPAAVQPPTQEVITRALGSVGISGINQAIAKGEFTSRNFPSPVREDGPGWRFEVDLPYGVTATQIIERREQLASGLRRPLGAVWPEVVSHEHAGRLECWVGKTDISKVRPIPWPWLRTGGGDVFGPFPFGTDPRQRRVDGAVIEHNWLIGSMPGQGKTSAMRVLVAACALDPTVEMWIHELKGTGDLDPFEDCSHRFISGIDDESIAYAAESLAKLRREVMARTERIKKLDRTVCPDKKVTRQIANKRSLGLYPVMCAIDECQNLFGHPKYGKQAGEDAVFIIKIGRALGVFLILATQRPDKESLPTGVSGNVSTRFCLKVAGQLENDMILGTSAYKNGARATMFRPKVDAGLGYLKGEEGVPQVVKTYYLNTEATERAARRARALREAAGTLSGIALGEDDAAERRDVLADVLAVFATAPALHWTVLAERLAERFPERWDGTSPDAVSAECRGEGVPSVVVTVAGERGRGCRLDAVEAAAGQR